MSTKLPALTTFIVTALGFVVDGQGAALIHDYELNGTLSDSLGGPALVPIHDAAAVDGTIGATGFTFPENAGLQLSNGLLNDANYSIQLNFSFTTIAGYRRIIDFKDRTSDTGLYNLNGAINFFPTVTGSTFFSPNTLADIIVTRDGTNGLIDVYYNGANVLAYNDFGTQYGVFNAPNNVVNFFRDDLVFPNEASAGFVDYIRVYNGALSAAQAACLQTNNPAVCAPSVPEPATLSLLGIGLAAVGFACRRRKSCMTLTDMGCRSNPPGGSHHIATGHLRALPSRP